MPVLEKIHTLLPELSKNERKVADYLLQYPYDVQRFPADAIASSCNTSRSAVIRLCQKLGYKGYLEFKHDLLSELDLKNGNISQHHVTYMNLPTAKNDVLSSYMEGIQQLNQLVSSKELNAIADLILYANKVITMGFEHSSYSANQLTFRLNRQGISSFSICDLTLMTIQLEVIQPGDVVVIFSISGSKLYHNIIEKCHQKRVKVILITMTPKSPLSKLSDYMIALPYVSHSFTKYLIDDAITFFLFIEILIEAIYHKIEKLDSCEQ